ncbi:MAG TPA: N-6 DNA methylase, partial [Xanthobacteraceae bacterium]|nr:N-6 DNA methylase [Xanthobacteraceae bacterium]
MTATQLSLCLFDTTSLASGLTLDAGPTSIRPATEEAEPPTTPLLPEALTQPLAPRRVERRGSTSNFRLAGDRPLAKSWRGRAENNIAAIRLMKQIAGEGREATAEEQAALIRFIGFGASELATTCFRRPGEDGFKAGWETLGAELQGLVTEAEYAGLARTTQYAHYTPESIVRAVWAGLERLGFTGGRILEPGVGTGLFIALMPEAVQNGSAVTGIEFDAISAGMSRLLYPAASIRHEDFTRARLSGRYDLAVGNPPYSDRVVRADPAYRALGLRLHDFFIAKAIDSLRPGGLAAFVTSTGTMDKVDPSARAYIAASADLLGAIRVPEGSFRATAGTEVVVDVLFFQKRDDGAASGGAAWDSTMVPAGWPADAAPMAINRYWIEHPEMLLGEHAPRHGFHGPGQDYTCKPRPGTDLAAALAVAVQRLPEALYTAHSRDLDEGEEPEFEAPS